MLVALLLAPPPAADAEAFKRLWRDAARHYRSLKTYAVDIEHQDDSGLFPGEYRQRLQWRAKDGRFDLVRLTPHPKVPSYYSDGKTVSIYSPARAAERRPLNTDPNTAPGYEVSGGMVMSLLLNTALVGVVETFAKPGTVRDVGRVVWRGAKAREFAIASDGDRWRFFFDASSSRILGFESSGQGKPKWMRYVRARENGPVRKGLGTGPYPVKLDVRRSSVPEKPAPTLPVGQAPPAISLVAEDGATVSLADLRGKVVVLDFWATWCGPCMQALPEVEKLAKADPDVVFLGVNVWEPEPKFREWRGANPAYTALRFVRPKAADDGRAAAKSWRVSGIPTQFVLDRAGKVSSVHVGWGGSDEDLKRAIERAKG